MTSRGVVRTWDVRGMSGVIDSEDTPGGSWTWSATVAVPGFPGLAEGQEVEFDWQKLDDPEQGCNFLTLRAWPAGTTPDVQPTTGFGFWNIDADGTVTEDTDLDYPDVPRTGTPASGVVTSWTDEGWGVIDSVDTPGGCWTFYTALHPDEVIHAQPGESFSIRGGVHGLEVGEHVDFEWESVTDQDGYKFRAIKVRVRRQIPPWHVERTNLR